MRTPGDFLVEWGWGGREVDDATWQPVEMPTVGSMWGHQGLFEALGAPDMPAQKQRYAPLQPCAGTDRARSGLRSLGVSLEIASRRHCEQAGVTLRSRTGAGCEERSKAIQAAMSLLRSGLLRRP
jgi:hypothetical protein